MPKIRRAVDYTLFRHITEQLLIRISGNGWMADAADRYGWQGPITIAEHDLSIPCAAPYAPPLRIAFASDFHAGPTTHPRALSSACQDLRAARPDLLLLGGDFVSLEAKYIDTLADELGSIPAPLGRFAVLGNHDLWVDDYPIVRRLTAAGVQVLVNSNSRLPAPFEHIWICGLDDASSGTPDAGRAFAGADGVRIVLMHAPEGLRDIQRHRFDLALCGHTHGGQIALPNGWPLWLPPGFFNRMYAAGRFAIGSAQHSTLIVSRGVGYGGLPIRLFADPDIVVCTLSWCVL